MAEGLREEKPRAWSLQLLCGGASKACGEQYCEIMLAFRALQLQLLAGEKSLEPFPSSFQWELCPWPAAQHEGSQQWAKCTSSLRTFSCLYLIVVLQIYFKWKNTEKKEQKSSLLRYWGRIYISSSFCLGRPRTHFEGRAAIFNMKAKQKQQVSTAFISNDSSSDVVCVAWGPFIYY